MSVQAHAKAIGRPCAPFYVAMKVQKSAQHYTVRGARRGWALPSCMISMASVTLLHYVVVHAEKVGSHFGSPGLPGLPSKTKPREASALIFD